MAVLYGIIIAWLMLQIATALLLIATMQFLKILRSTSVPANIRVLLCGVVALIGSLVFGYVGMYASVKCYSNPHTCGVNREAITAYGVGNDSKSFTENQNQEDNLPEDTDEKANTETSNQPANESDDITSRETTVPKIDNPAHYGYYQAAYEWATANQNCSTKDCTYIVHWIWPNWSIETFYNYPPVVGAGLIAGHDNQSVLHFGNVVNPYPRSSDCQAKKAGYILRLNGDDMADILNDGTPNKVKDQLNDATPSHIVWKKIEEYYYIYAYPPSGLCSAEYANQQKELTKVVQTMVRNLAPLPDGPDTCNCSTSSALIRYIDSK